MRKYLYIFVLIVIPNMSVLTQPFYTQLDNVENFLSPSFSGLSLNQDIRLTVSFRNSTIGNGSPFMTGYVSADGRILARSTNNAAWIGWGLGGLYDVSGNGLLETTATYANLAYHQSISPSVMLSAGLGIGIEGKQFNNFNSLVFSNQWDGGTYDRSLPSLENYSGNPITNLDMQAGINVTFFLSAQSLVTFGGSVKYLNQPMESFFNSAPTSLYTIKPRYAGFVQSFHEFQNTFFIKNNMYYTIQGSRSTFTAGSILEWAFNPYLTPSKIILGTYYRYPSILAVTLGIRWKAFRFMFSYDLFLDDASSIDHFYRSAQEAHLSYYLKFPNNRFEQLITICPTHF